MDLSRSGFRRLARFACHPQTQDRHPPLGSLLLAAFNGAKAKHDKRLAWEDGFWQAWARKDDPAFTGAT
jgi:hypothetical protein